MARTRTRAAAGSQYALVLGLIVVVGLAAIGTLGANVKQLLSAVGNRLGEAAGGNVTSLSLKLYGIQLNEASGSGSAIIAGADGVQMSYALGDEIVPGVKLKAVFFDHVLLDRGGAEESLFIDQSSPAPEAGGPPVAGTTPMPGVAAPMQAAPVVPAPVPPAPLTQRMREASTTPPSARSTIACENSLLPTTPL